MDQPTFQTIIEGGILITLVYLGGRLIGVFQGIATSLNDISNSLNSIAAKTGDGGSGGSKGGVTNVNGSDKGDDSKKQ